MKYKIMLYCDVGTTCLRCNPLRWERKFHTITVCAEDNERDALASLMRFRPIFPSRGEHAWIEVEP